MKTSRPNYIIVVLSRTEPFIPTATQLKFVCALKHSTFSSSFTMLEQNRDVAFDVVTAEAYFNEGYEDQTEIEDSENASNTRIIEIEDEASLTSFDEVIPVAEVATSYSTNCFGLLLAFASGLIFTANNCVIQIFSLDYGEMFAFVFLHRIHVLIFMKLICLRPVCISLRFICLHLVCFLYLYWIEFLILDQLLHR